MEVTNFKARRKKLLSLIGQSLAIIPAGKEMVRSHDTHFPFRQNSHFKYLTGFPEPEAILVLCHNNDHASDILFVRPKDPLMEMWVGKRHGVDETKSIYDFDQVYSIDEFETKIDELLIGHTQVYIDLFDQEQQKLRDSILKRMQVLQSKRKVPGTKPDGLKDINPIVGKLRLRKDKNEIQLMKKAAQISSKTHRHLMSACKPGINESDLYRLLKLSFASQGAPDEAYESIIASGNNANTLHYIENNSEINDGDLVLIDAGCEFQLYASDITRTFPANGKFTDAQKTIYTIVLNAQKAAIAHALPGRSIKEVHLAATKELIKGLVEEKIIEGNPEEILEDLSYREYYPHGTSHWLGMDVHDPCPYLDDQGEELILSEGMVFTIEPGLYFNENSFTGPQQYKGIGIRIEDDILITDSGHEILTAGTPKEIKEVEEQCQKELDWNQFSF